MVRASLTGTHLNILRIAPFGKIPSRGATYVMPSATVSTTTNPEHLDKRLKNNGEPCWVRTSDLLIKKEY
jgi:hypothetical protein